jgi:hypothetical protein
MAAEVKLFSGPSIVRDKGELRGEAVMWVKVGQSHTLRPVRLTTRELIRLAAACLQVLQQREGVEGE